MGAGGRGARERGVEHPLRGGAGAGGLSRRLARGPRQRALRQVHLYIIVIIIIITIITIIILIILILLLFLLYLIIF